MSNNTFRPGTCCNCGKGYLQSTVKLPEALAALYCSAKCQRERVAQMARIVTR